MENCASKISGHMKPIPSIPATSSDREQRLQIINQRRVQNKLNLSSQSSKNDETSLNSTQSFTFPNLDAEVHTPRSPWNSRQYSERFSRRLDVEINAQKSYFEAKISQERDEYALRLAELKNNMDTNISNAENNFLAQLESNAEQMVQNILKENLIQAFTDRILNEIAKSPLINNLADEIINHEENLLQTSMVQKLK